MLIVVGSFNSDLLRIASSLSDLGGMAKGELVKNKGRFAVEFRDVSLAFEDYNLLDRISFNVPRGEMRILIGPSNCGKSTILRLAIGLLKPDSGEIFLDGLEISSIPEEELFDHRRNIGMVLQTDALFSMSVAENVAYRLPQMGLKEEEVEAEVRRVLHLVGLDDAYDLTPDELSGGMSRRASIARAIAGSPEILFYDSPCSGLDPIISRRLVQEIIRQRDIEGVSSIYVTQNMDEVRYLCSHYFKPDSENAPILQKESDQLCLINTRVLMLDDGKFIFNGEDELLWGSKEEKILRFIA
jgi:phospholipid/cholesterol/gamma-HCH transport system ATP-binding protein